MASLIWLRIGASLGLRRWTVPGGTSAQPGFQLARMMMADGRRLSGIVAPHQHVGMIAKSWAEIGKPMPVALALAVEPPTPFIWGMPLPGHVNGSGLFGALMRRPMRTVRCRTVDLEAPTSGGLDSAAGGGARSEVDDVAALCRFIGERAFFSKVGAVIPSPG